MSQKRRKGCRGQLHVAALEDVSRVVDEPQVAGLVARILLADLREHALAVSRVVEPVAVVPDQAIERMHGQQLDVVGHSPAGHREQLLQAVWRRDDRRAAVEDEPALLVRVRAPPRLVARLEDRRLAADSPAVGWPPPARRSRSRSRPRGVHATQT
jgi:hypothetical protein